MGSQFCSFKGSHQQLEKELLLKPQIQSFFLKYPLINQKFKLQKKYLPQPHFQTLSQNKNSILFKSQFISCQQNSIENSRFTGIVFQQASKDSHQPKYYNALFYQGEFNEFKGKDGIGIAVFDNGDTYEGEWKNNMIDGNGIYTQNQNRTVYQGQFRECKKQGKGKLVSNVQQKFTYEGDFQNNQPDGYGKIQYQDGSRYSGEFKNGFQEGQGESQTKSMKYQGFWKKGVMNGSGTCVWYSESVGKKQIVSKYIGQYLNGKKHGFGQYQTKNGKLLRGEWFEGKFNPGPNSYIIG